MIGMNKYRYYNFFINTIAWYQFISSVIIVILVIVSLFDNGVGGIYDMGVHVYVCVVSVVGLASSIFILLKKSSGLILGIVYNTSQLFRFEMFGVGYYSYGIVYLYVYMGRWFFGLDGGFLSVPGFYVGLTESGWIYDVGINIVSIIAMFVLLEFYLENYFNTTTSASIEK